MRYGNRNTGRNGTATWSLIALLSWPFLHVESGVVHIPQGGTVVVGFKKYFKKIPSCSADKPVRFITVSREWAEIQGQPGERVAWSCR